MSARVHPEAEEDEAVRVCHSVLWLADNILAQRLRAIADALTLPSLVTVRARLRDAADVAERLEDAAPPVQQPPPGEAGEGAATPETASVSPGAASAGAPVSPGGVSDEMVCDRCGRRHGVVWFAPSDVWNAVMREGDRGKPDLYGFCCPECFMQLAAEHGYTGWLVCPFNDGPVDRAEQIVLLRSPGGGDRRAEAAEARAAELREQLDTKLTVESADEWLAHRFNQVWDEKETAEARVAEHAGELKRHLDYAYERGYSDGYAAAMSPDAEGADAEARVQQLEQALAALCETAEFVVGEWDDENPFTGHTIEALATSAAAARAVLAAAGDEGVLSAAPDPRPRCTEPVHPNGVNEGRCLNTPSPGSDKCWRHGGREAADEGALSGGAAAKEPGDE